MSPMSPDFVGGFLSSILAVILAPYVSARIKRTQKVREESAQVEVRRLEGQEKFYDDLQARLVRTEEENDELNTRVIQLQRDVIRFEGRLEAIAADVGRVRDLLGGMTDNAEVQAALALLVQLMDKIRRREDAKEGAA